MPLPNSNAPSLEEIKNYAVNRPGSAEVIGQSLYDFQIYPTAGATRFSFFQLPQGQGLSASPGNANAVKGLADTNMESAGQLPAPKAFLVTSIEVSFEAGTVATANTFTPQGPFSFHNTPSAAVPLSGGALNDVHAVLAAGWLELFIGSKPFLDEAKLSRFPLKADLGIDGTAIALSTANSGQVAAWGKSMGRPYPIDPPLLLVPNQNFVVTLNYPVARATPSGFNGRIGVILDGYLYRNAQ